MNLRLGAALALAIAALALAGPARADPDALWKITHDKSHIESGQWIIVSLTVSFGEGVEGSRFNPALRRTFLQFAFTE